MKVKHLDCFGLMREVLGLGRFGWIDGWKAGEGAASSSCVGGDGVMEGMAVERAGVLALSNDRFKAETSPDRSSNNTTALSSIDTRFVGDERLSSRFFTGEEVADTVPSRSSVEWRLPEVENESAAAATSRRGGAGVVEGAAAVWRSAMAEWSTEGDEGGEDMVAF